MSLKWKKMLPYKRWYLKSSDWILTHDTAIVLWRISKNLRTCEIQRQYLQFSKYISKT